MKTKILRQIQKQILAEPSQFQMCVWFTRYTGREIKNCGTAACIGGWALAFHHKLNPKDAAEVKSEYTGKQNKYNNDFNAARLVLGLSVKQANRLFTQRNWPEDFYTEHAEGTEGFAQNAAKRIDHFIKTKGKE